MNECVDNMGFDCGKCVICACVSTIRNNWRFTVYVSLVVVDWWFIGVSIADSIDRLEWNSDDWKYDMSKWNSINSVETWK